MKIYLIKILCIFIISSVNVSYCKENIISYSYNNTSLKQVFKFVLGQDEREIVGYNNVPDKIVKRMSGQKVDAKDLEKLLLKCAGLKIIPFEYYYKIVKDESYNNKSKESPECRIFCN